ncbi:MAG TPA: MgtC/SapB family protein, partial [Beijerinckiaceae bacterium]|nr:MgtC/SapB family protein [Beijerinckiaceae bacterium]
MSIEIDLLQRLGVAVAIGAVVGVERHWRERDAGEGRRTAGLRTYSLTGLLGGCAGLLEKQLAGHDGLVIGLMFLGFAVVFAQFNLREAAEERNF